MRGQSRIMRFTDGREYWVVMDKQGELLVTMMDMTEGVPVPLFMQDGNLVGDHFERVWSVRIRPTERQGPRGLTEEQLRGASARETLARMPVIGPDPEISQALEDAGIYDDS